MTLTTSKASHHLIETLGDALSQTFSELQQLRSQTSSATEELLLLKLLNQTLREENLVLRDKKQEVEELLSQINLKKSTSLVQQKQFFKKQQSKVANVLQKALKELKKTKSNLEEVQRAHKLTQKNEPEPKREEVSYNEVLELHAEENNHLAKEYHALLQNFLTHDPQQDLLSLKQKHENELSRLKVEFQAILQKSRQETILTIQSKEKAFLQKFEVEKQALLSKQDQLKQNIHLAHQRLIEAIQQSKEQAKREQLLQEAILQKEEECRQLKSISEEKEQLFKTSLQESNEWQEKYNTSQVCIHDLERELAHFTNMQKEFERMQALFSTIKSYMGSSSEIFFTQPKSNLEPDLFSQIPPPKKLPNFKQDLFEGMQ
ncbi:MAG: hypothetical protein P4L16_05115 [Chlamydiales bacterium]|nr:hypothetical protein [Chlamydiales bacterium]